MSRLRISNAARADLLDIWTYVAENNGDAADHLIDEITTTFQTLLGHPKMGRRRDEFDAPIRSFPVRKYVIYYRLRDDGIEIYRVYHSARDVERLSRHE